MVLGQRSWTALAFGVAAAMSLLGWASGGDAQFITEYLNPTAGDSPNGITAGPDGALWFTNSPLFITIGTTSDIDRITTSGTITKFIVPTANSLPAEIPTGPDGALWFTDAETNAIGRITTSGTITEYALLPAAMARISAAP